MDAEVSAFSQPFTEHFGHEKRGATCLCYIAAPHAPGDYKSIKSMAAHPSPGQYDFFHHFISDDIRDDAPIKLELTRQADRMIATDDVFLVIDDTALLKKGEHPVGVARQ